MKFYPHSADQSSSHPSRWTFITRQSAYCYQRQIDAPDRVVEETIKLVGNDVAGKVGRACATYQKVRKSQS